MQGFSTKKECHGQEPDDGHLTYMMLHNTTVFQIPVSVDVSVTQTLGQVRRLRVRAKMKQDGVNQTRDVKAGAQTCRGKWVCVMDLLVSSAISKQHRLVSSVSGLSMRTYKKVNPL